MYHTYLLQRLWQVFYHVAQATCQFLLHVRVLSSHYQYLAIAHVVPLIPLMVLRHGLLDNLTKLPLSAFFPITFVKYILIRSHFSNGLMLNEMSDELSCSIAATVFSGWNPQKRILPFSSLFLFSLLVPFSSALSPPLTKAMLRARQATRLVDWGTRDYRSTPSSMIVNESMNQDFNTVTIDSSFRKVDAVESATFIHTSLRRACFLEYGWRLDTWTQRRVFEPSGGTKFRPVLDISWRTLTTHSQQLQHTIIPLVIGVRKRWDHQTSPIQLREIDGAIGSGSRVLP